MKTGGSWVRKLTEEQKVQACSFYGAGESLSVIAKRFDLDRTSIWSLLKRRGIKLRPHCKANRRCQLNESAFDVVTEESAYWVGLLMADGCVIQRPYSTCISLSLMESDGAHIEAFRSFLGSSHKIDKQLSAGYASSQPQMRLAIASQRLADALARFGVLPRKSLAAHVIGLENDKHFWRGVIDGDGCIFMTKTRFGPKPTLGLVGAKELLQQFSAFAKTITNCKATVRPMAKIFSVSLRSRHAIAMARHLYFDASIALPRKLAAARAIVEEYEADQAEKTQRKICTVPHCGRKVEALGYCLAHYKRFRKHGHPSIVSDSWHNLRFAK